MSTFKRPSPITIAAAKNNKSKGYIVIPYMQGLFESIKNFHGMYGIQTYFKGNGPTKNIFLSPEDRDLIQYKSGEIYWYKYKRLDYNDE